MRGTEANDQRKGTWPKDRGYPVVRYEWPAERTRVRLIDVTIHPSW